MEGEAGPRPVDMSLVSIHLTGLNTEPVNITYGNAVLHWAACTIMLSTSLYNLCRATSFTTVHIMMTPGLTMHRSAPAFVVCVVSSELNTGLFNL